MTEDMMCGFCAAGALTSREEAEQNLADGSHKIALQFLEHVHVHVEGVVRLFNDAISSVLIDRQLVHGGAVAGFERLFIRDFIEDVEAQTVISIHIHRLLGNVLEDLTAGEVTHVTGVVMTNKQLG